MTESGVDLGFDLLQDGFDEGFGEGLTELKWRVVEPSSTMESSSLKSPAVGSPMTRTTFKQQLQRQQLEQMDQQEKKFVQSGFESSQGISIPQNPSPPTLASSEVPTSVLQVKTKLENPTRYYVAQQQKRQVKEYLKNSSTSTMSLPNHFTIEPTATNTGPSSQPTLNAINQQAVATLTKRLKPSVTSSEAAANAEVDNLLDDIISLESNQMDDQAITWNDPSMLNTVGPVASSMYDLYGGLNFTPMVQNAAPSSCPAVLNEPGISMDPNMLARDRQKKDNHNMIERRRRFNINDRIKELGTMLPKQDPDSRQNKGTILKASVDYIRNLKKDVDKMKLIEEEKRQLEMLNRKLLLRVQELEMHARAHGIPTTPLTSDTSTALLSTLLTVKPEPKSPVSTCSVRVKQEPVEVEDGSVSHEPMDGCSLASSRNPSPGSIDMDDDDDL
ncbi:predicted protein [Nematostella vectensis]|uniref:BHLH domain-containing protein n=1 Tax=Nematostella vectensis TaxID=45351 RepID=A7RVM3_NEMVE|nr:microphthalmia-associated transcription factor isoform X2 [Nematostella vectensis]EDO44411.1 predicted protein [Nematostella vectensis]|eukprot:XP_001636474.1 predicted protein [Nematostella vectensis]